MFSFFSRKDAETKERELELKTERLRAQVRELDFEKQGKISGVLLLWLRPLVHLGKIANLTPQDIPPAPRSVMTGYTRPIFYAKWNAAIEKIQRQHHQKIQSRHQDHVEAYQKYRASAGVEGVKKVSKPKELPTRLQKSIPYTVTSVSELHHLPTPKPFDAGNATPMELRQHLRDHPAIGVLDELYRANKLPSALPIDSSPSQPDSDHRVNDDLGDLGTIPEIPQGKQIVQNGQNDQPSPQSSQSTPPPTSPDPISTFSMNPEDNSMRKIKEPEIVGTWVIFDAWKRPVLQAFFVEAIFVTCNLLQPTCVKKLANYFTQYRADNGSVSTMEGILYALLLCLITACTVTSVVFKIHNQMNWAARSSSSYLTSIFHKLLRAAPYSMSQDPALSPGTIINLTSQDATVPFNVMIHVLHVVSGPLMLAIALLLLCLDDYGSSALITTVMMLLLIPYQFLIARLRHWLRRRWLKATDARLQKTIGAVQGVRVAKIYSWDSHLKDQIQALRDEELSKLRLSVTVQVVSDIFMTVYPLIVTFVTIAHYVSRGNGAAGGQFDSAKIVVLLAYLNAMRLPIQFLGAAMQSMIELWLSGGRIGHFLSKEELPVPQSKIEAALNQINGQNYGQNDQNLFTPSTPKKTRSGPTPDPFNTPFVGVDNQKNGQNINQNGQNGQNIDQNAPLIKLSNVDFYWSSFEQTPHQTPVLSDISIELKRGDIVGLISESGMGKSALLQGIFGELYPQPHRSHSGLTSITNLNTGSIDLGIGGSGDGKKRVGGGYEEFRDEDDGQNHDQNGQNMIQNDQNNPEVIVDGLYSFNNRLEIIPSSLINLNGRVGYAAQTPWILNDTIRANVIMNLPFDKTAFQLTVAASSLGPDLEIFPDGDYTLVSEQGVSLSGGQQARLAFARVVYAVLMNSIDIVIIDDIFAAVDAYVARNMFFRGVCGIIKPRCGVFMALNSHYEFLSHCSSTFLLDFTSDTYYLTLHQYILAKKNYLINKVTAQKVLEGNGGDFGRSMSLLSTTSSLESDHSNLHRTSQSQNHHTDRTSISHPSHPSQIQMSASPSYTQTQNGPYDGHHGGPNHHNGGHNNGITRANSSGLAFTNNPGQSNSNTHTNNLHQTPLIHNQPRNQPVTLSSPFLP
jgi:ABC-type multidrug transport system fused ATPase/permease subunit